MVITPEKQSLTFLFRGRVLFLLFILIHLSKSSFSQYYNLPNEYFSSLITKKKLAEKDSSIHAGIQPYIHFYNEKYVNQPDTYRIFKYIVDDPALDVAFFKHVIRVQPPKQDFRIILDPLLNLEIGHDFYNGKRTYVTNNTRGFIGAGYIGKNVYFESIFAENQSIFPQYIYDNVVAGSVIMGQGRWKAFKGKGFDYAFSSGFVSIQAARNINIQVGHGKQKIGHGYRSLLLSDNAFNYPYARITQQWFKGRLQYTNTFAVLMNLDSASKTPTPNAERLFQKKAASFQYLSFNPAKFLNVGLFQGMIWQAGDAKNAQHIQWQYFNPVIFTNLPQYGLNNSNNILIGADLKLNITNKLVAYGQIMADDLSNTKQAGNGYGYQAGLNYFDAFRVKNLFLQMEYNNVNEGSYTGPIGAVTNQSFSHYNQNLAYTPGYGQEIVGLADYKFKRFSVSLKYHYQNIPKDREHYYTNTITGVKLAYLINPAYNLNVFAGYTYRNQNFPNFKNLNNETNFYYLGVRTSLYNIYYDF